MDLAKIAVKLRPRNPWEGIDLGFMMAREWFLPLWLLWMISALPLMLLIGLMPMELFWKLLALWWLKPLYEPPLLYWMGRRMFGERPSWRELRQAWRRVALPQLFANLTWRRLNPARSFVMPVSVLERLRAKARSERIRVLSRKSNAASWLTIIGIHFESIFQLGFFLLLAMLVPEELAGDLLQDFLLVSESVKEWGLLASALLAMSMVAPFYVAGGFALYLTRRSELEGWDIELGLRAMVHRQSKGLAAGLAALLLGGALIWGMPATPLQAAEQVEWQQVDRQQVREAIQAVLSDEDFGREQEATRWRYIGEDSPDQEDGNLLRGWLSGFSQGLASISEALLWLAGGGILAYLLYWFINNRNWNPAAFAASRNGRELPTEIAGLDLRPESLPDDPASEAERLIEAGDFRGALSLLYRAALSVLIHQHALEIPVGATEGECQGLVTRQLEATPAGCFSALTRVWLRLAYAHQPPERERALTLCREWRSCFGETYVQG
ncbi:MAG: DUF4129 domain-containing protein [Candidatus Thiodiazotropha sp.]